MKNIQELSKDELNLFLSQEIKISEKLTGTKFSFIQNEDSLHFYGRDKRFHISIIDRTLSYIYENPISHIRSLNLSKIPTNTQFCFEYFYKQNQSGIIYDNITSNGLVLTHIIDINGNIINDIDSLRLYSKLLKCAYVKTYFSGYIDIDKIEVIIDLILNKAETKDIIKTLKSKIRKGSISSNLNNIEGLIFESHSTFKYTQTPSFIKRESSDNTNLMIMSFIDWLCNDKINSVIVQGSSKEERYIDLMTKLITNFILENSILINGYSLNSKQFANSPIFKLNTTFIINENIRNFINANIQYSDIYKLILSFFTKKRKTLSNIIDEHNLSIINSYISIINNTTNKGKDMISYSSYKEWKTFVK